MRGKVPVVPGYPTIGNMRIQLALILRSAGIPAICGIPCSNLVAGR